MRTVVLRLLVIIVVTSVALVTIGGTTATWSDTETVEGNVIETGSLDLLVAKCAEGWTSCGEFSEDPPWCSGLTPCFDIPEAELGMAYACYLLLWNAGCVDGVAYLHVKNVANEPLASSTNMRIWYDHDGLPETTLMLVGDGTIGRLACHGLELGPLPGEATRQLKLEISPYEGSGGDSLTFDIVFELIQHELLGRRYAWADTEQNSNCLTLKVDISGTPGFWQTHYDYTKHVFNEHLGGTINLGWKTLDSEGDVFGMLWANNAHESDDSRRDKLCQARVTVSFQAVAAILNSGLDNGAPLPVSLADIAAILAGTDIKAIRALGETLDAYNNSGVDVDIVDDCPYPVLPADPDSAKEAADITVADC